ncbi:hypothetical protein PAXRUDRAFT_98070, partial [Paxillus rubicundulus Ve08.2h10]
TINFVSCDFWWPSLSTFVHNVISGCAICQSHKANTHPLVPSLSQIPSAVTCSFQQISIDLIIGLPVSDGFDSLMVMVDHGLTKGVILSPCSKTNDATGIADLFLKTIYTCFGL